MIKHPVAVLISGNGSNLQALMDACAAEDFPARITLVISNKDDAYGLERAKKAGIETHVIRHTDHVTREAFDEAMHKVLKVSGVRMICLAGFMRVLTPQFVQYWEGRIINIHPSLLPSFKGLKTHEAALAAGVKLHGCSVHYVIAEMDSGPIIAQAAVPVLAGDTPETLRARAHKAEHVIYPIALKRALDPAAKIDYPAPAAETMFVNY